MLPERLAELPNISLDHGQHESFQKGHCAMEVAAYIAGEPHSDAPVCVCPIIRRFLVTWNDRLPNNQTRDRLIKPLLPKILDTKSSPEVERKRGILAADWLIRESLPAWLDLAKMTKHATEFRSLPELTSWAAVRNLRPRLLVARDETGKARAYAAYAAAAVAAAAAAAVSFAFLAESRVFAFAPARLANARSPKAIK